MLAVSARGCGSRLGHPAGGIFVTMAEAKEKTTCRAWLVVLSLNITFTLYGGLNKVFGVLMPELREQLATDTWLLGWVITMIGASVQSAGKTVYRR